MVSAGRGGGSTSAGSDRLRAPPADARPVEGRVEKFAKKLGFGSVERAQENVSIDGQDLTSQVTSGLLLMVE